MAEHNEALMQAELFSTLHSAMTAEASTRHKRASDILRRLARWQMLRIDAALVANCVACGMPVSCR